MNKDVRMSPDRPSLDEQDSQAGQSVKAFALLHLICCAAPLLIYGLYAIGAVALTSLLVHSTLFLGIAGALLTAIALGYYFGRGCATCPRLVDKVQSTQKLTSQEER